MGRFVEAEGKHVEDAIEKGLGELGTDRDSVTIEILDKGKTGVFGIGTKLAKVRLTLLQDDAVENAISDVDMSSILNNAEDFGASAFLDKVFEKMGVSARYETKLADNTMHIDISGDNMGIVIGRRGEVLDALQYLTTLVINKNRDEFVKVSLDSENYRAEREKTLVALANKLADKARRTNKNVYLEPMNAYERKIIHAALQDADGVYTYSVGEEPSRKIVITTRPPRKNYSRGPRR